MHYRPRLRRILIETEWFFDYDTTQAHVEWDRSEVDRSGGALTVREKCGKHYEMPSTFHPTNN